MVPIVDFDAPSVDDEISDSIKNDVEALLRGSTDDDDASQGQAEFGVVSRSSTPSIPPGFENAHAHPNPTYREDLTTKLLSKMVPTSAEFTPRARAATPLSQVSLPTSPVQVFAKTIQPQLTSQARLDTKALATSSGLSKEIASQASQPTLQAIDFPALESAKAKGKAVETVSNPPVITPAIISKKVPSGPSTPSVPTTKAPEKRTTPGVLSIPAPVKAVKSPPGPESSSKTVVNPAEFPALKPATLVQPPAPRSAPKTLRVAAPIKAEAPSSTPLVTPSSSASTVLPQINTSRQVSHASLTKGDTPGTPTSEVISDNVSMTDTSMSRANSPPPTRIGSAPVRENTKSMQKKTRVQRAKEKAEQDAVNALAAAAALKAEPVAKEVAPVLGRKKRQKKDRTVSGMTSATAHSTPSASRAPSPGPAAKEETTKAKQNQVEAVTVPQKPAPEPVAVKQPVQVVEEVKQRQGKTRLPAPPMQEPQTALPSVAEDEPVERPFPTAASVLQDLVASREIDSPENLGLLKPPTFTVKTSDVPIDMHSANQKLTITPEDRATLLAGKPVHKISEGPNRIMLTPNGDCVRNLSPAEEQLYLELQARIANAAGPTAFISPKYHSGNGFTLIGGRAVPNGPPSFFPSAITNAPAMDPVSKIQRDEALSYINQYVLPSLSSNTQLEKALNANALDRSLLHAPIDASNWAQWGHDILPVSSSAHPETAIPSGTPNPESMLGLDSITAHFAVASGLSNSGSNGHGFAGNNTNNGAGSASVGMLSVGEAESALQLARKEAELFEKRFNALLKKNRKLLLGSGH